MQCNKETLANPSQSHTFAGRAFLAVRKDTSKSRTASGKPAKECACPTQKEFSKMPHARLKKDNEKDRKTKRIKSTMPQHCISVMRAELLKLSFLASNKLCGRRTMNRSEIPHYAYTWPLCAMVKKQRCNKK